MNHATLETSNESSPRVAWRWGYRVLGCRARRGAWYSASAGGFSFVELLVSLAVTALLLGLVAPALSKARRESFKIKCASNQRQIGIGVGMYAGEWFDFVPREGISPYSDGGSRHSHVPWVNALARYLGPSGAEDSEGLASPAFLDPAHPNPNHCVHYVMNGIAFARQAGTLDPDSGDGRGGGPAAIVRNAAAMIYLTAFSDDRDNSIAGGTGAWNLSQASGVYDVWNIDHLWGSDINALPGAISALRVGPNRHGDRNNILHLEGHVAEVSGEALRRPEAWYDGVPLADQ